MMKEQIHNIFQDSQSVIKKTAENNLDSIIRVVDMIFEAFESNKKILFFGNGGSAADSQHVAAEFVGRFQKERKALAAIALTTDTSILTALSNDYSYEIIFARQIEAIGQPGDVAIGFSTSGKSKNVIAGMNKARDLQLNTISFTGCGGGSLGPLTDINLDVPSTSTARIQEAHMCLYHTICELVENKISG